MKILVVGSGGREHALSWKLAQSEKAEHIYVAPGNGGTAHAKKTSNVPIAGDDIPALLSFAQENKIALTVVGPEMPLVAGLVDAFTEAGLPVFGPTAQAAQLEGSKAFAKTFMIEEGIPTAPATAFSDYATAAAFIKQAEGPFVIKADGLAAGKGVLVCDTPADAHAALKLIMVDKAFGSAGDRVVIETRLSGEETSLLAFSDGRTVLPMLPARDYKRALDGDQGLNTGGMGGYAPSPYLPPANVDEITRRVLQPVVDGMANRGMPYVGILYAGLMLTEQGPRVLEFNCRFGDPETQLLLPLLETDLVNIMQACIGGYLDKVEVRWKTASSVGVVLASGGYPNQYTKGYTITGLEDIDSEGIAVFHAGTTSVDNQVTTSGGRVLAVTAWGPDFADARTRAYAAAAKISFDGCQYRTDIATNIKAIEIKTQVKPKVRSAYAAAGVDIDAGEKAVDLMRSAVRATYTPDVLGGIGAFGGSLSVEALARHNDLVLVSTTDGVGTKTAIATAIGKYDTIGHDIVNHCVNDILVQGARPLLFLDYIASSKLNPELIATVVQGCATACKEVGCVLIGGETAEMPGVYAPGALDLVGTMVGWVDRSRLIDGQRVKTGNICLGIPSTGLHTNGFTLARHVLHKIGWHTVLPEFGKPLGEVLLAPHRAYLREIDLLWQAGLDIKGMSHLTGGAFIENIPRVLPPDIGVRLDRDAWETPAIFRMIQEIGQIDNTEMYRVFNMGIGYVVIIDAADTGKALKTLPEAVVIGETIPWDGSHARVLL